MEHNKLADTSLGLNPRATAVLHMLSEREPPGVAFKNDNYQCRIQTAPWYNGREKGYVVSFSLGLAGSEKALYIAFAEHRNVDVLFVETWEGGSQINPVCTAGERTRVFGQSVSDQAYNTRKDFQHIEDAVKYITRCIELYTEREYASQKSETPKLDTSRLPPVELIRAGALK